MSLNLPNPTETIFSKKGTKEDIKLQVPRLTKENMERCLLPYQICDKRQSCHKNGCKQNYNNNNDPKNKL